MGFRCVQSIKHHTSLFSPSTLPRSWTLDEKLGWKSTENYFFEGSKIDAGGFAYKVTQWTDSRGFKQFGDTQSLNKIFFVGDSFTQAIEVSNGKTYYGLLAEKMPDCAFFAYGVGGYGTLQEYMVIDKYIDEINPDLVIIQFCTNDFINNDLPLEQESYANNNNLIRPYMNENGDIFYEYPRTLFNSNKFRFIAKHSKLLSFINFRIGSMLYDSVENEIVNKGLEHRGFKRSIRITTKLMKQIKQRCNHIAAFCVDYQQPFYDEVKQICFTQGIHFIDGIPQNIEIQEQKGFITRASDKAHWNELGHQIAANKLYEYLRTQPRLNR